MAARSWQIEEASQRLDELIEAAKDGEQTITRDGKEVAVVVSSHQFDLLRKLAEGKKTELGDLLLSVPKFADLQEEQASFRRQDVDMGDVDFSG